MRLDLYDAGGFDRGAARWREVAWLALSGLLVASWLPGSSWRVALLRAFGAQIGRGVVIKPRVRVKFPWRLVLGDHVWIGEAVWIDNLAPVTIGAQSCLSQGAYLCTGSHDWSDPRFGLVTRPIVLEGECWVGARACLAPGTTLERGAVLAMGALGRGTLAGWVVHGGAVHGGLRHDGPGDGGSGQRGAPRSRPRVERAGTEARETEHAAAGGGPQGALQGAHHAVHRAVDHERHRGAGCEMLHGSEAVCATGSAADLTPGPQALCPDGPVEAPGSGGGRVRGG